MWYLAVLFIGFVVYLIINGTKKDVAPKKDVEKDYWDDKIINETLSKQSTPRLAYNRNKTLGKIPDITFEVKGLTYRSAQAQLEAVLLEIGDKLELEEEPNNNYDASAVKVLTLSGECIGYVDKEHCVSVGALINLIDSCVVIKKSSHQIPYITAKVSFKE